MRFEHVNKQIQPNQNFQWDTHTHTHRGITEQQFSEQCELEPVISVGWVHFDAKFVVFKNHRHRPILSRHSKELLRQPLNDAQSKRPTHLHTVNQRSARNIRLYNTSNHCIILRPTSSMQPFQQAQSPRWVIVDKPPPSRCQTTNVEGSRCFSAILSHHCLVPPGLFHSFKAAATKAWEELGIWTSTSQLTHRCCLWTVICNFQPPSLHDRSSSPAGQFSRQLQNISVPSDLRTPW